MINIGDMNKKIEIYGFGWDKDELGQKIRKEKLIARVWAKVRLIRSSESIKKQRKKCNLRSDIEKELIKT